MVNISITFVSQDKMSANYVPAVMVNKVLLNHGHAHLFIYFSVTTFVLQLQSCITATEDSMLTTQDIYHPALYKGTLADHQVRITNKTRHQTLICSACQFLWCKFFHHS